MIAIAVDDEILMLGALVKAINASPDIREVTKFSNSEEALEFVKKNQVDIAFLDINMRGMGGLALAENIIAIRPNCKIVFCTGYEQYAVPAFKLRASGYLMKPISAEDVQGEINNIKGVRQKEKTLTVKCFGNFEVYVNGEKLTEYSVRSYVYNRAYEVYDVASLLKKGKNTVAVRFCDGAGGVNRGFACEIIVDGKKIEEYKDEE